MVPWVDRCIRKIASLFHTKAWYIMNINEEYSGLAYVGKSTLRHEDEKSASDYEDRDEYESNHPECRPHVFIDFQGVSLADAIMGPSKIAKGSSGIIVQYQKEVRDGGNTKAQVEKWRENHVPEMLENRDVDNLTNKDENSVLDDILAGAPFVILDPSDVTLDIPKQPEDMRRELEEFEEDFGVDFGLEDMSDAELRTKYQKMKDTLA